MFGHVSDDVSDAHRARIDRLATTLTRLAKLEVSAARAKSYSEITEQVLHGKVDFAWLPPVPYIALSRREAVDPLVSLVRSGHAEFYSVLIARADSRLESPRDLAGKRAAWVDPHSASGYVLPRIGLSAVGIDPRHAFREERFFRSHDEVVRAVVDHRADFGATFGGLDAAGTLARGPWTTLEGAGELRVLATFGAIPPDVIAARADLDAVTSERLTQAFVHAASDPEAREALGAVFGRDVTFKRGTPEGYLEFCRATMRASDDGLLQGEEKR